MQRGWGAEGGYESQKSLQFNKFYRPFFGEGEGQAAPVSRKRVDQFGLKPGPD